MKNLLLAVATFFLWTENGSAKLCEEFLSKSSTEFGFSRAVSAKLSVSVQRHRDPHETRERAFNFIDHAVSELMKTVHGISPKSVFYPAAGNDAISAFKMFKDADLIVGLDSNPFVNKKDYRRGAKVEILPQPHKRDRYDSFGDVGKLGDEIYDVATVILTDLKFYYPNLIIESVETLKFPSERQKEDYALGGKIQFREYRGGPLKTYLHIQLPYIYTSTPSLHSRFDQREEGNDIGYAYLIDDLLNQKFDVIIAKASMNFFHGDNVRNSSLFPNPIGPLFIEKLSENKGVLLNMDIFDMSKVTVHSDMLRQNQSFYTLLLRDLRGFIKAMGTDNKGRMYGEDESSVGLGYVLIEDIKITIFP